MSLSDESKAASAKGPHPHNLLTGMRGGGGGRGWEGGPRDFLGSEILAKGIFWVCRRRTDFFGSRKKRMEFLGVLYFLSAQINNDI